MIDITDKTHQPTIDEIDEFIGNPLFSALRSYLVTKYKVLASIEYSGDNVLLGWNVCFRKAGKTLIRLYPKKKFFKILLIIGRKEKDRTEQMLPDMSYSMREIYQSTKEGMGQRWILMDLCEDNSLYQDILKLIEIRRTSV